MTGLSWCSSGSKTISNSKVVVEQLMGKLQHLDHITSSQEEITDKNKIKQKTKQKGNKMWIHHLKGDVIRVIITLNRPCNG
jgi:hypothetical protein